MSTEQAFFFFFEYFLCAKFVALWNVDLYFICGRKTDMHDELNILRYSLVLNCKMQRSGIIGDWELEVNAFFKR